MTIISCILCGFISALAYQKHTRSLVRPTLYLKSIVFNLVLTLFTYSYYIGYKKESLSVALFHLTPNCFYFICMSIFWCVVNTLFLMHRTQIRRYITSGKQSVKYNIMPIDQKLFWIIMTVSLLSRIVGYNWGAGMTFHPDESEVTHYPEIMARDNTLLSGGVYYPAQISGKILVILYEIYGLVCQLFNLTYSGLVLNHIARILIALFSVGTVVCIYFIGNHLKEHAGTVAAMIASVFPPFVQMAHCVTGDPIVAFLACLSMICAFYYYSDKHKIKWLMAMTILAALAGLEKYNGAVLCVFVAIIVISDSINKNRLDFVRIIKEGLAAILCMASTIFVISPNLVKNYQDVLDGIAYVTYGFADDGNNTFFENFYQYMMEFTSYAGVICFIFLIIGIICLAQKPRKDYCVFSSGLILIVSMCLQNRALLRWGYIFYACFIIIIGFAIVTAYEYVLKSSNKILLTFFSVLFFIVLLNNASGTIFIDTVYSYSSRDTRVISWDWCVENGITPLDCVYDNYTCFNPGSIARNVVEWDEVDKRIVKIDDQYVINTLGRKYAIANISRNGYEDCLNGLPILQSYEPLCPFDGFSVDLYPNYSLKIYDLYSIKYTLSLTRQIINNEISFGSKTIFYDISSLPAYQTFTSEDSNGKFADILSITEGEYSVKSTNGLSMHMCIYDENGNLIVEFDLIDGYGTFELPRQYYNTKLELSDVSWDDVGEIIISKGYK